MLQALSPDYAVCDLREVDWRAVKNLGFKTIFIDLDNTLSAHGSESPDPYARQVAEAIVESDLQMVVISNAKGGRGERFARALGVLGLSPAHKPNPREIVKMMDKLDLSCQNCLMVGDQILTDVWGAHRAGIKAVKVPPRFRHELWSIRPKRCLEKILAPFLKAGEELPQLAHKTRIS